WCNVLDPSIKLEGWTKEEDANLASAVSLYGFCWSKVAISVPPRTDNQCRRRWKVLHPQELAAAQKARKIRKAALISNFVGRKKERPTIGPGDFLTEFEGGSCSEANGQEEPCAPIVKKRVRRPHVKDNNIEPSLATPSVHDGEPLQLLRAITNSFNTGTVLENHGQADTVSMICDQGQHTPPEYIKSNKRSKQNQGKQVTKGSDKMMHRNGVKTTSAYRAKNAKQKTDEQEPLQVMMPIAIEQVESTSGNDGAENPADSMKSNKGVRGKTGLNQFQRAQIK
ncbi:hypothetical protein KI387_010973, partial [Taxus chinensis]